MTEIFKYISPLVLLALIVSITADFCTDVPAPTNIPWIVPFSQSFNPYCYVKSFDPEKPEVPYPYQPITVGFSAVVASGTSLSTVPYGSLTKLS
ncbi:hypothetical protein HYS97_03020 [Candidatus Daviesbacteria bacterium]|nr:hypothetical protein [Candidatus Daviesbacteria bacterium]